MDNYRPFDQIRTNELTVTRQGWFRPNYELTDGQFSYGKIIYTGFFRICVTIEVANKSWSITRKGVFSRTLFISKTDTEEIIGEIKPETWSRKIGISMADGFQAVFTNKKAFGRTFTMTTENNGDLFVIEPSVWKFKTPFKINLDPLSTNEIPDMPLLLLSGVYLALMRQQQAAAAASV